MAEKILFALGTKVKFGAKNEYEGEITAITLRKDGEVYEISYWKQDEPKSILLRSEYFTVNPNPQNMHIGFK